MLPGLLPMGEDRLSLRPLWLGCLLWSLLFGTKAEAGFDLLAWSPAVAATQSKARFVVLAREDRVFLGLHISLEPGWHTYWLSPGDSGAAPRVDFEPASGSDALLSELRHPAPVRKSYGPLVSYLHEGDLVLLRESEQKLPISKRDGLLNWLTTRWLGLDAEYLVCTEEECIPAFAKIPAESLERISESSTLAQARPGTREPPDPLPKDWTLLLEWIPRGPGPVIRASLKGKGERKPLVDLFEASGEWVSTRSPFSEQGASLVFEPSELASLRMAEKQAAVELSGVIQIFEGEAFRFFSFSETPLVLQGASPPTEAHFAEVTSPDAPQKKLLSEPQSFGWMLLFAFLGGVVLNFMPCVFPVLSLKVLSILRHGATRPENHRAVLFLMPSASDVAYLAGCVMSILTLGLILVALRGAGVGVGWGAHLQSPLLIHALVVLFLFLALGFWGAAPRLLASGLGFSGTGSTQPKSPLLKEFLTGVLAVVVASPCTAPFMATALGFALLTESAWQSFGIFSGLGLGFATPLFLLAVFPPVARAYPKPGPWVSFFERLLGFPLVLTCIWLMWVASQQVEAYPWHLVLLWLVVFSCGLWLWQVSKAFWPRVFSLVLTLSFVTNMVLLTRESAEMGSRGSTGNGQELVLDGRGMVFETWDPVRIEDLRQQGVPVFIDFTARWCVTCQVNKKFVFEREDVAKEIEDLGYRSFVADWTNYDPKITEALESFGRAGVPLYVLYPDTPDRDPTILGQLLTPEGFLHDARQALLVRDTE